MTWDYRPPTKFDATISSIMEKVIIAEDRELNYFFPTESAARAFADKFRYFRWCVRYDSELAGKYHQLELDYDYRTKIMFHPQSGWYCRVRCIPNRLGYMFALNPWLSVLPSQ